MRTVNRSCLWLAGLLSLIAWMGCDTESEINAPQDLGGVELEQGVRLDGAEQDEGAQHLDSAGADGGIADGGLPDLEPTDLGGVSDREIQDLGTPECELEARRCRAGGVEICLRGAWIPQAVCPAEMLCVEGGCEAGPCDPSCAGRQCGPDGCGDACGECAPSEACELGLCQPLGPRCGDQLCQEPESCWSCPADCGSCCGDERAWRGLRHLPRRLRLRRSGALRTLQPRLSPCLSTSMP